MTPTDHPLEELLDAYGTADDPPSNPRLTRALLLALAVELALAASVAAVWWWVTH